MAQLRDHDAIRAKRDFFLVDPRKLSVDPTYNVRDLTTPDAREGLDELKAMVRADGVQIPLVVRMVGDDLTIVQGHRRHTVVMELIAEGEDIKLAKALEGNFLTPESAAERRIAADICGKSHD